MSEPARRGARSTIDRQRLADWSRALFKGTAYLTLFLLDIFVVQTIWNDFDGISPGGWFGIFWLAVANTIMLPKVTRAVFGAIGAVLVIGVFIGVFILLWFIPTNWLPPYAGLIIVGVLLVYALFTKLDAINANLVRANELKERERVNLPGRAPIVRGWTRAMTDWGPDDLERTAYHEAGAPAAKEAGRAVDRELRGIPSPDAAGRLSNVYR